MPGFVDKQKDQEKKGRSTLSIQVNLYFVFTDLLRVLKEPGSSSLFRKHSFGKVRAAHSHHTFSMFCTERIHQIGVPHWTQLPLPTKGHFCQYSSIVESTAVLWEWWYRKLQLSKTQSNCTKFSWSECNKTWVKSFKGTKKRGHKMKWIRQTRHPRVRTFLGSVFFCAFKTFHSRRTNWPT